MGKKFWPNNICIFSPLFILVLANISLFACNSDDEDKAALLSSNEDNDSDDDDDSADCIDVDEDGYGTGIDCLGSDCNDEDSSIYTGCPSFARMAAIPTGCFDMGDGYEEGHINELPVHSVCLSSFYIDQFEVTNLEYKACVDSGNCTPPTSSESDSRSVYFGNSDYDNYPVIYIDWEMSNDYCSWAGKRLPTEAEWEFAARGGLSGKRFSWGDEINCSNANYYSLTEPFDTEDSIKFCAGDTSEVGDYETNGFGLYDMDGNVTEWVNDWLDDDYYSVSPTTDPTGPPSGTLRAARGGNWASSGWSARVSERGSCFDTYICGFRCASSSIE